MLSDVSKKRLATCAEPLQQLINKVALRWPLMVLEGHRGQEAQDAAYAAGKSKLKYPHGKHNSLPSQAVDVIPTSNGQIDWNDTKRICFFAGYVLATADSLGLDIRWGGDWDGDYDLRDNTFNDLVHFEIRG